MRPRQAVESGGGSGRLQEIRTGSSAPASDPMDTNSPARFASVADPNGGLPIVSVKFGERSAAAVFAWEVATEVMRCDLVRATLRDLSTSESGCRHCDKQHESYRQRAWHRPNENSAQ